MHFTPWISVMCSAKQTISTNLSAVCYEMQKNINGVYRILQCLTFSELFLCLQLFIKNPDIHSSKIPLELRQFTPPPCKGRSRYYPAGTSCPQSPGHHRRVCQNPDELQILLATESQSIIFKLLSIYTRAAGRGKQSKAVKVKQQFICKQKKPSLCL